MGGCRRVNSEASFSSTLVILVANGGVATAVGLHGEILIFMDGCSALGHTHSHDI